MENMVYVMQGFDDDDEDDGNDGVGSDEYVEYDE